MRHTHEISLLISTYTINRTTGIRKLIWVHIAFLRFVAQAPSVHHYYTACVTCDRRTYIVRESEHTQMLQGSKVHLLNPWLMACWHLALCRTLTRLLTCTHHASKSRIERVTRVALRTLLRTVLWAAVHTTDCVCRTQKDRRDCHDETAWPTHIMWCSTVNLTCQLHAHHRQHVLAASHANKWHVHRGRIAVSLLR